METPAGEWGDAWVTFPVGGEGDLPHSEWDTALVFGLEEERLVRAHCEAGVDDVGALVEARR